MSTFGLPLHKTRYKKVPIFTKLPIKKCKSYLKLPIKKCKIFLGEGKFKRKIYDEILKWKNSINHKPLIIRGLRQIGKTTIVENFAKENY